MFSIMWKDAEREKRQWSASELNRDAVCVCVCVCVARGNRDAVRFEELCMGDSLKDEAVEGLFLCVRDRVLCM